MSVVFNILTGDDPACSSACSHIAYHNKVYINAATFKAAVSQHSIRFKTQPDRPYALFTEDAYPFAVILFALLHAGKEVWVAGNNRPGTAQQLQDRGCRLIGEWPGIPNASIDDSELQNLNASSLSSLDPATATLVVFTSGSNGVPKPIEKRLSQLLKEVSALEKLWGAQLGNSDVLSTVSHQHIYGLLFRILWPLAAGRCFHSRICLNPDILVNTLPDKTACWIASPAHLKRLDEASPWDGIRRLSAIFSSGGALPASAWRQMELQDGPPTIEIYGSSETGGIGWRRQNDDWTLFPGLSLKESEGRWLLRSPYQDDETDYPLDDRLILTDERRFILEGRTDRVVKIEEKRLSLSELEQRLSESILVADAYTLLLHENRDIIAAVVVLNPDGRNYLETANRSALIRHLKNDLQHWFEPVMLPRKWLFTDRIPQTSQGKIERTLLAGLLSNHEKKLPKTLSFTSTHSTAVLVIKIPQVADLIYFPDHFPAYPILPGVVQLAWVSFYGQLFFDPTQSAQSFSALESVKFIQIIRPGDELTLTLNWKAETGELCFNFGSNAGCCSSGRMVYRQKIAPGSS